MSALATTAVLARQPHVVHTLIGAGLRCSWCSRSVWRDSRGFIVCPHCDETPATASERLHDELERTNRP